MADSCRVCGDEATGRHYGAFTCEGCKGFFKRAVRKHQGFRCRNGGDCLLNQKRTKCQSCRFRSCLDAGMRVEAVQQERQRLAEARSSRCSSNTNVLSISTTELKDSNAANSSNSSSSSESGRSVDRKPSGSSHSTSSLEEEKETDRNESLSPPSPSSSPSNQFTLAILLGGELLSDAKLPTDESGANLYVDVGDRNVLGLICQSLETQLNRLMDWAQYLFHFVDSLSREDQGCLFQAAWPELVMLTFAYNSVAATDGVLLSSGRYMSRARARQHGLGPLVDRILNEIVSRFREMQLGRVELILLRAIVLFNPDATNLTNRTEVEAIREKLYTGLHAYCMARHGAESSRFTKLMLRLPTVRAISHKCLEHLVFVQMAAADPSCRRIVSLIERGFWWANANFP